MPRGKRLRSQAKEIVMNVYRYFEKADKKSRRPSLSALKRTSEATGVSVRSVQRLLAASDGAKYVSPKDRYEKSRQIICVDDFDRDAIRRNIHRMYEEKKHLTLTIILHALKEDDLFAGGRSSLAKLLKDMGFGYKKVNNKRYYFEQPRIIEQRHNYLRRMRLNRQDKRPVVYLDETWANAHDGKDKAWVEKDDITGGTIGGIQRPSGKGSRLIILHAGSENGWVPNCSLVFKSSKTTGDYHDEMTSARFEEWWNEKLLPNIPPNTLIVMDNAPYHSRRKEEYPVQSWSKKKMMEWLDAKAIPYPEKCLKTEIWSIVKRHRPVHPEYHVDDIAKQAGHEVVRLPVAHCELNPIEMAWSQVKHFIQSHNKKFTLTEMERLTHLAFDEVTPERWKSLIAHIKEKVEDHYWEADGLQMELVDEFIISLEGDSDSDSYSSDSSDSGDSD